MPTKTELLQQNHRLESKLQEIKELVFDAKKDLKEMASDGELVVLSSFHRSRGEEPTFNFELYAHYEDETILEKSYSIDEFLRESEDVYGCGDEGWGYLFIEDLEKLKAGIQRRIDAMKKAIETETYDR